MRQRPQQSREPPSWQASRVGSDWRSRQGSNLHFPAEGPGVLVQLDEGSNALGTPPMKAGQRRDRAPRFHRHLGSNIVP